MSSRLVGAKNGWTFSSHKVAASKANTTATSQPRQDNRYIGSFALTYKLTREMQLKGELRREWLTSNMAGNNYQAYVALLGVRLQR